MRSMKLQILVICLLFKPVLSTWSILALDGKSGRFGVAVVTCLDKDDFPQEAQDFFDFGFQAVPCRGAIQAQAIIQNDKGPAATIGVPLLVRQQQTNVTAQQVVDAIASPESDSGTIAYLTEAGDEIVVDIYSLRQYGVVVNGYDQTASVYTGTELTNLYRAFGFPDTEETGEAFELSNYTVAVQGNIVFPGTITSTGLAFRESVGKTPSIESHCGFAELLLDSLKAGYEATGGDVRCADFTGTKGGILGYLKVIEPSGEYSINLQSQIGLSENRSALDELQTGLQDLLDQDGACVSETAVSCGDTGTMMADDADDSSSSGWMSAGGSIAMFCCVLLLSVVGIEDFLAR